MLREVVDPDTRSWLEAEHTKEVEAEVEDAPAFALFDIDNADTEISSKPSLATLLQEEPSLNVTPEMIPARFRSPAWCKVLRLDDTPILTLQGNSGSGHGDVIWAASEFCVEAILAGELFGSLHGRRILEVGAGVGLPSCVALRSGASVVSTDIRDSRRLLALATTLGLNLRADTIGTTTEHGTARVVPHFWGESCEDLCRDGLFDLVFCCDCIYIVSLHAALLDTLETCLAPDGLVFVSFSLHETAPTAEIFAFFDLARARGLKVEASHEKQLPPRCKNMDLERSYVRSFLLRR